MRALPGLSRISFMAVSQREVSQLFQQLAVMLEAGLGLERSLEILAVQIGRPVLRASLDAILEQIRSGFSVNEAFAAQRRLFPAVVPEMIKVGETGGVLAAVCLRISAYLEGEHEISNKILTALAYPAIVFVFAITAMFFISIYIMPMFAGLYASSGVALPYLTVVVIKGCHLIKSYWVLIAPVVLLGMFMAGWIRRSDRLHLALHKGLLFLPVVGRISTARASLQMAETLAVLLKGGVPVLTALRTAAESANNRYFSLIIGDICKNVEMGRSIAVSLALHRQFDEMFVRMVAAGEESGNLDRMLVVLSRHLHKDLLNKLDNMVALLEPALVIMVALVVGTTVVATLLPMYGWMNTAGGI